MGMDLTFALISELYAFCPDLQWNHRHIYPKGKDVGLDINDLLHCHDQLLSGKKEVTMVQQEFKIRCENSDWEVKYLRDWSTMDGNHARWHEEAILFWENGQEIRGIVREEISTRFQGACCYPTHESVQKKFSPQSGQKSSTWITQCPKGSQFARNNIHATNDSPFTCCEQWTCTWQFVGPLNLVCGQVGVITFDTHSERSP